MTAAAAGARKAWARARRATDDLSGEVALVTGASRGLGLLLARELARHSCRLIITARDGAELDQAADRLRSAGAEAVTAACDVRDEHVSQLLLDTVTKHYGRLDILLNNAGIIQVRPGPGDRHHRGARPDAHRLARAGPVHRAPRRRVHLVFPGRLAAAGLDGRRTRGPPDRGRGPGPAARGHLDARRAACRSAPRTPWPACPAAIPTSLTDSTVPTATEPTETVRRRRIACCITPPFETWPGHETTTGGRLSRHD